MSSLSLKELEEKLTLIDADLTMLRAEPGNDRKLEALAMYRDFISDQIEELKNEQ